MTKPDATNRQLTDGGLRRGDTVEVKRKPTADEKLAWVDAWVPRMDAFIGSVGTVDYVGGHDTVGIKFTEGDRCEVEIYNFPEYCVKKAEVS